VAPYRDISSLHSRAALGLAGAGRKWVFLSAAGWSRFRTQHSSPDLDHWPANTQQRSETSALSRNLGGSEPTLGDNI